MKLEDVELHNSKLSLESSQDSQNLMQLRHKILQEMNIDPNMQQENKS